MDDLSAAVAFLSGRGAAIDIGGIPTEVVVSGPLDLGAEGALPPTCIVQATGPAGDEPPSGRERMVGYALRFYGPDDLAALSAHAALRQATYANAALGVPVLHTPVGDRLLRWFAISAPTGPLPEPETNRPVVLATGRAKWAS